jgi:DNA-binding response OmpR family regulator
VEIGEKPIVLVATGTDDALKLFREALSREYQILVARDWSGTDAELQKNSRISVAFVHWILFDVGPVEFCRRLANATVERPIPVVLLSKDSEGSANADQPFDYVLKFPCDPSEIRHVVKRMLMPSRVAKLAREAAGEISSEDAAKLAEAERRRRKREARILEREGQQHSSENDEDPEAILCPHCLHKQPFAISCTKCGKFIGAPPGDVVDIDIGRSQRPPQEAGDESSPGNMRVTLKDLANRVSIADREPADEKTDEEIRRDMFSAPNPTVRNWRRVIAIGFLGLLITIAVLLFSSRDPGPEPDFVPGEDEHSVPTPEGFNIRGH